MDASHRQHRLPGANSPELLLRLLETIASGVRSTRGLEEALGVDPRTVNYYTQTGQWLGFLCEPTTLSARGLAYVYAAQARPRIYAEAVWSIPDVSRLLGSGDELPSYDDVRRFVGAQEPGLADGTLERRVSALRALLAPAVGWRQKVTVNAPVDQLGLPLGMTPALVAASRAAEQRVATGLGGLYHQVLCTLLDYGELTLGMLRAFFDRWGATDEDLGESMELAVQRGDAIRMGDALVVTAGAIGRRSIVATTASVILSDPSYRAHLAKRGTAPRQPDVSSNRTRRRHAAWDIHLFGREAAPDTLKDDLDKILLERPLSSFPLAGRPGTELPLRQGAFLEVWSDGRGVMALPPSLEQLKGGLQAVNRSLKQRRPAGDVGLPSLDSSHRMVHGGLFFPGEHLPRSVPDVRSLQARAVSHSPYVTMLAALLLVHRSQPNRVRVIQRKGRWSIVSREGYVGTLLAVLDGCGTSIGWWASRRTTGGMRDDTLLEALQCLGLVVIEESQAIMADPFFRRLREAPEEQEILLHLRPLAHLLERHVSSLEALEDA